MARPGGSCPHGQGQKKDCGVGTLPSPGCASARVQFRGEGLHPVRGPQVPVPSEESLDHSVFCKERTVLAQGFPWGKGIERKNWACMGECSGWGPGWADEKRGEKEVQLAGNMNSAFRFLEE